MLVVITGTHAAVAHHRHRKVLAHFQSCLYGVKRKARGLVGYLETSIMSPMIRTPVSLVAFDLDGTLIRGDTVCQAIAREMGHLERMNELERLTALEDIAAARSELVSYYASETREQLLSHVERCKLAPGAEEGFALLRYHKVRTAIVSITWTFAVEWFARKLGADYWVGTRLSEDGHVDHFWPEDKARWVRDLMRDLGLRRGQVAAVGDSWGDAQMLRTVGHPFYLGETLPSGLEATHCPSGDIAEVTRRILDLDGGVRL